MTQLPTIQRKLTQRRMSQSKTRRTRILVFSSLLALFTVPALAGTTALDDVLMRTNDQVAKFVDQFSDVKCTEHVEQQKIRPDGKIELKEESTFDYLVILTNAGGEISLDESRLPVKEEKKDQKKRVSMLVSNGFATLFLVFHPYYSPGFRFTDLGEDTINGHTFHKIHFEHIPGMRSPAALALRGREYPLELAGVAWIDPKTGVIARIQSTLNEGMEDIGLRSLTTEVDFAPVPFNEATDASWYPVQATIEVESPRQHWRNIHRFTDYKKFSVSTEEKVAQK
jgi:hypothetical protein